MIKKDSIKISFLALKYVLKSHSLEKMEREIQWDYGEKLNKPAILEENCCGMGKKEEWKNPCSSKQGKKKFSLALSSTNRTWVAERKKQRIAFRIMFFSLPQMENFIAVSSDFCIVLRDSFTMNCFKRSCWHFFLLIKWKKLE